MRIPRNTCLVTLCLHGNIKVNPLEYGYELKDDEEEHITPKIIKKHLPDKLPMPCKCVKCAKSNICSCRVIKI